MASSLPGYRIERELGRGGMGVVYHATREQDGLGVAIKTIKPAVGTSGARLKARGAQDVRTAVRIVCQMLSGLAHAHAKGFVPRDIKLSNILIAQNATKRKTKLADFGLARVYEASRISGLTMQGDVGGTAAYMTSEQVTHYRDVKPPGTGEPLSGCPRVSARTDQVRVKAVTMLNDHSLVMIVNSPRLKGIVLTTESQRTQSKFQFPNDTFPND